MSTQHIDAPIFRASTVSRTGVRRAAVDEVVPRHRRAGRRPDHARASARVPGRPAARPQLGPLARTRFGAQGARADPRLAGVRARRRSPARGDQDRQGGGGTPGRAQLVGKRMPRACWCARPIVRSTFNRRAPSRTSTSDASPRETCVPWRTSRSTGGSCSVRPGRAGSSAQLVKLWNAGVPCPYPVGQLGSDI